MKERIINTRFWGDSWVRKLNPLDRYLFLYLLTNEHTNICGIYELPLATMAYESGLDERDLEKTMLPRLEPKVYYHQEWIILTKFLKYQHTKSEAVMIGVKRALNEAPKEVLSFAKSRGYRVGRGMASPPSHILELELEPKLKLKLEPISGEDAADKKPKFNPLGEEVIKAFEEIDPKNKTYYSNKTQRAACDFLISEYGLDKTLRLIKVLPELNQRKLYIKQVTSPYELKENWVKIGNALKQLQDNKREVIL